MFVVVFGKTRRFRKMADMAIVEVRWPNREFYPVVAHVVAGMLTIGQCSRLQEAGVEYLPEPERMNFGEREALKKIIS